MMRYLTTIFTTLLLLLVVQVGFAQNKQITVKGTVTDKTTGSGAIGVSILADSKAVGATHLDGSFSVKVDAGATLTFKYIGYEVVHKKVQESTDDLKITIAPATKELEQVSIVGYQKKTKATNTGAVTHISGKEISQVPVANVTSLLQGKVAGLNIQVNNGAPGVMGRIQLRGLSTTQVTGGGFLKPTSPLFIVDGVPVDPNQGYQYGFNQAGPGISPLSLIPPEDIASVDVLKDAAATSIYGSRGAYGVIIITTKRGKSRIPIVRYTANAFFNTPPKLRKVIGGKRERELRIWQIMNFDTTLSAAKNLINRTPFLSDSLSPYFNNSTNWQDLFFRTTYNMSHNLSISGGNNEFNYKTNLNYYQENGIIKNTGFKRYSFNMNTRYQPSNQFKMTATLNASYGNKDNGSGVGLLQTGVSNGANASSLLPPPSLFSASNEILKSAQIDQTNKTTNLKANVNIQWEPVHGIRLGDVFSYDYTSSTSDRFLPSYFNNGSSRAYNYDSRNYTLYNRATLSYTKVLNEKHTFNAFLFDEIQKSASRSHVITLVQTPNDDIRGPIGSNWFASGGGTLDNLYDKRVHGYGGAFTYNYMTKYILNFSYRFDGTSTNGPAAGYSRNPAISARWNFNKEPWLKNVPWISYTSIRASWGRNIVPTGNIFDVYGLYGPGGTYNGRPTMQMDYTRIPNTGFKPQTSTTTDVGLEGGLFDSRFEFVLDGYYKSVDNQITDVQLANMNGFEKIKSNAISLVDYGIEWTFTYRLFAKFRAVQSTLSINGAYNKDVLTRLPQGLRQMQLEIKDGGSYLPVLYRLGRNTLSNLLYFTNSVYSSNLSVPTDPATGLPQQLAQENSFLYFHGGDPRWADVNGDYKIDDNDFVIVGNPMPLITGGINDYTTYKNWSLRINMSYTLIRDLLNINIARTFQNYIKPTINGPLLPIDQFDYWKPTGKDKKLHQGSKDATYPNPFDFTRSFRINPYRGNQTLFLEDGSYWKINTLTLAYNIPKESTRRFGITSTKIYVTANNVFTFSNYSGPDPENVTALGRDVSGGYPNRRSYTIGLNVQF